MRFKQALAVVLGASILVSLPALAHGLDLNTPITISPADSLVAPIDTPATPAEMLPIPSTMGKIIEIGTNQIIIQTEDERYPELALNISPETAIIDNTTGNPVSFENLKKDETISAYFSYAMTRSIPPQSAAYAIITNIAENTSPAKYMVVSKVQQNTDGSVTVLSEDNQYLITILNTTEILPYKTKQIVTVNDIKEGTPILAWFEFMTLSIPAQATATRVVILPQTQTETETKESIVINEVGLLTVEDYLACVLQTLGKTALEGSYTKQALAMGLVTQEELDSLGNQPITRTLMYKIINTVKQIDSLPVDLAKLETAINQLLVNSIEVNGELLILEHPIQVINGQLMIPLRQVAEKAGFTVEWDQATNSAKVSKGNTTITYTIDKMNNTLTENKTFDTIMLINSKTYITLDLFKGLLRPDESVNISNGKIIITSK